MISNSPVFQVRVYSCDAKISFPEIPQIERILSSPITCKSNTELVNHFNNSFLFESFSINKFDIISFKIKNNISSISMPPLFAEKLGFLTQNTFVNDRIWIADKKPFMSNSFNQYYIYSSIADPIMVGGVHVPLMKAVWVESKHNLGDVINENVDRPMYFIVSSQSINNIEVQIRDDSGELINFPYGSKSNLTLHFQ